MKRRTREIARAGIFGSVDNPQVVLVQDLMEIAETWPEIKNAPIKLGSHWTDGNPRLGNVVNVTFDAKTQSLWAEIDEHDTLAHAVDVDGFYPDVSIGAKARASDGKMYLHHIAYLGDEPPAVKALHQEIAQTMGADAPVIAASDSGKLWQLPSSNAKRLYLSDSPPPNGAVSNMSKPGESLASLSSPEEGALKENSMTEEEIQAMKSENERLQAELAQRNKELADQAFARKEEDKAKLKEAAEGKLTQQEMESLMELADTFEDGKEINLSDGKGKKAIRPAEFLTKLVGKIPNPVEPGVLNLSDSPNSPERNENLAMKMMAKM